MTQNLWDILNIQLKAFASLFFLTSPRTTENFVSALTSVTMEKVKYLSLSSVPRSLLTYQIKEIETESWVINTYF